jgi:hypothetical protein
MHHTYDRIHSDVHSGMQRIFLSDLAAESTNVFPKDMKRGRESLHLHKLDEMIKMGTKISNDQDFLGKKGNRVFFKDLTE